MLWTEYNDKVITPCFPRMNKTIKRRPQTQRFLQGPVILKTDAGLGRMSKQAEIWEVQRRWHEVGLVILLVILNAMAATQHMNQGFECLKKETKETSICVAGVKMAARVAARKKSKGTR